MHVLPFLFSPLGVRNFQVDSRQVCAGSLFFALPGQNADGHSFLNEVFEKGAAAAIVSDVYQGDCLSSRLFRVHDPLLFLQNLARVSLEMKKKRIVGVTGSVGKTSTKDWIHLLLEKKYSCVATEGNQNSQIGLPLTVLNHLLGAEEIAVLEMGMSFKGQIKRLTEIAPPEVAVLTTVALAHAANFSSIEEIARAKGEIFSHPKTRCGILPFEYPLLEEVKKERKCPFVTFSLSSRFSDYGLSLSHPQEIEDRIEGLKIPLEGFSLPGMHHRHNLLAACATARYFGVSWEDIVSVFPVLKTPKQRFEHVHHPKAFFVNDSYNACEVSVKAALSSLPFPKKGGRKIAVLGEMLELGRFSNDCHQEVGESALKHVDVLFCLGKECEPMVEVWKNAQRPVFAFQDRSELVSFLRDYLFPEDIVLLKGSRAKQMWKIMEDL